MMGHPTPSDLVMTCRAEDPGELIIFRTLAADVPSAMALLQVATEIQSHRHLTSLITSPVIKKVLITKGVGGGFVTADPKRA